jgi:hypothetical protein
MHCKHSNDNGNGNDNGSDETSYLMSAPLIYSGSSSCSSSSKTNSSISCGLVV